MKRKFQVFISSTYTDLISERQAAVSAILKAGHIPAGMELFTAGDKSQMETIKEWIDESDVYMLILGGRYGSIESSSGVSYTELEYDYAVEQGRPVFAVVITENALEQKIRILGSSVTEKENPKELAQFRKKVLSNISSFFDDSKDIKLCVHESLADFAAKRELKGWVSATEIVDTKPLFDEISKLSRENAELKEAIAGLQEKIAQSTPELKKKANNFDELESILRAIEVKIPASITKGEEKTENLFSLFYLNKDHFLGGVINENGVSDGESFLYHNMGPKLLLHGLVENEKVPGVKYRRTSVTKLGREFLAEMEKRVLLKKAQKQAGLDKK
jgi:hypothetical protein